MTSRILALRRGKTGDVQHFSKARPANPAAVTLLNATLGGVNQAFRTQVLSDPNNVYQFICSFGDKVGFFTRPTIIPDGNGGFQVLGNFTDSIGEPLPLMVSMAEFQGHFTTLTRVCDAAGFGFATHPITPDLIEGTVVDEQRIEATLGRLNFTLPENPVPGDYPIIAAIPNFIPVGPGQTAPHLLLADDPMDLWDTFPLLDVYRRGLTYARLNNNSYSVTKGGPLFHPEGLVIPPGSADPFANLVIHEQVPRVVNALLPTHAMYATGRERLLDWSEAIWIELGSALEPEPVAASAVGGGFTPAHFRAAIEPLVSKEKTFTSAGRTMSRYRLLLASAPPPGTDIATLPDLRDEFKAYVSVSSSATAGDDLRELVRSRLTVANGSHASVDRDVTLEPENITLAFSDRVRCFGWLHEKLISTSHAGAKSSLGLLQLLTPERCALAIVAECDLEAATLLMSNSSSSTAQLDASKASKLYCAGRLTDFRHSYEAVLNFRCLMSVLIEQLSSPMLLQKLLEYVALLVDREGRLFFESNRCHPYLAVHPWQDLQTILSAFCRIAVDSTLYGAVTRGEPVAISNYQPAIDVSNALIADLRAILHGNGLGKFLGRPVCASWFSSPVVTPPRGSPASVPGGDAKRQRTQDKSLDPAEAERRKTMGLLDFDSTAAGSTRLPICPVYFKRKGAKTPERLCMRFLTRGHVCDRGDCKFPHLTTIAQLSDTDKTKFTDFVKKQPGLSFAEGRAPPGTT